MSEANRQIGQFGAPAALQMLVSSGKMTQENAESILSGYLGTILLTVTSEASRELKKISGANERIRMMAREIDRSPRISFNDPRITQLHHSARAFDGWAVSLLETDYKIMGLLEGSMMGIGRAATLAAGLQSLLMEKLSSGTLFPQAKRMVF